jgi:cob(I)alamin adenosyltransferase
MKIYTRTGDRGDTSLLDGTRVPKSDPRVEAYGDIDELNALLGWTRAAKVDPDLDEILILLQRDLFALGALLADPAARIADRVTKVAIGASDVGRLERWIDQLEEELPPLSRFILPGGSAAASTLHLARTVCRRAERRVVELGVESLDPALLAFVNRLSDLLFVFARVVNKRAGCAEVEW